MKEAFPEVCSATVIADWGVQPFFMKISSLNRERSGRITLFFETLGFTLLSGHSQQLGIADQLFISERLAKRMFEAENPVGKVLKFDKNHPYTVQGVFKDIPENCHLQFDVVASFENIKTQFGRNAGWNRDDSYMGYVRLVAGSTPEVVEKKIPDLLTIYQDEQFSLDETEQIIYYLEPVSAYHLKYDSSGRVILVLSVLGLIILVVAAMNYILISLSSLPLRTISVGIHKCNGASAGSIFRMFLSETCLLVLAALLVGILLLSAFRTHIEGLLEASVYSLFTFSNLLWPGMIIGLIFFLWPDFFRPGYWPLFRLLRSFGRLLFINLIGNGFCYSSRSQEFHLWFYYWLWSSVNII